jgi:hypothetical protein
MLIYFSFRFYKNRTAIILCLVLSIISFYGTLINFGNSFKNNDYRKIISHINSNESEGDKLIVEPHFMGWAINYHNLHSTNPLPDPSVMGWDIRMQLDSLSKTNDFNRFWFVLDYSSMDKEDYDSLPEKLASIGYDKVSERTFYLIPAKVKVQLYESIKDKTQK